MLECEHEFRDYAYILSIGYSYLSVWKFQRKIRMKVVGDNVLFVE